MHHDNLASTTALGSIPEPRPEAPDALALTVQTACRVSGLGTTTIYHLIAAGRLDARKAGGRTLILADSLRRYIESLPAADIRTGRSKEAA